MRRYSRCWDYNDLLDLLLILKHWLYLLTTGGKKEEDRPLQLDWFMQLSWLGLWAFSPILEDQGSSQKEWQLRWDIDIRIHPKEEGKEKECCKQRGLHVQRPGGESKKGKSLYKARLDALKALLGWCTGCKGGGVIHWKIKLVSEGGRSQIIRVFYIWLRNLGLL